MDKITDILHLETKLEKTIVNDPIFIQGAFHGKIRPGHPEGFIVYHIRDIFENIDKCHLKSSERKKLRLIALFHDICKFQVNRSLPRIGKNNHGWLARQFAQNYITDENILQIIHYHDTAYNIWKRSEKRDEWKDGEKDLLKFISTINDLGLYTWFYFCDNSTGDKTQGDFEWFFKLSDKNKK